jgi:hypothetical protein
LNLDDIKAKCIECGDCWEWTGICSSAGVPKINLYVGYGKNGRTVLSTRRVVWQIVKGAIPAGRLITTKCGNPKCLNPEHLTMTNHAQVAQKNGARLSVKLKRAASQRTFNIEHRAKLTQDAVSLIRSSEKPTRELAGAYGVHISTINKIRKGLAWRDVTNPFAALMA